MSRLPLVQQTDDHIGGVRACVYTNQVDSCGIYLQRQYDPKKHWIRCPGFDKVDESEETL